MTRNARVGRGPVTTSQAEFTMRTETHKFQDLGIWFSVDQHEIGFDMAIAVIFPGTGKCMITVLFRQGLVGGQNHNDRQQVLIKRSAVLASCFALVVSLEARGPFNRPHGDRIKGPRHCPRQ